MKINYEPLANGYATHRQVHPGVLQALEMSLRSDSKVLDIGSGTGNYMIAIEQDADSMCWGIDPSEKMIAIARSRDGNSRFSVGKGESISFPKDMFDMAFSVDVIHHVENRLAFFQEIYRVLVPGGQICTVTDSEEIIRNREPLSVYFPETIVPELKRYPGIHKLKSLMTQVGFNTIYEKEVKHTYSISSPQKYRDKAFSCLHLIPSEAYERGLKRMERDLREGEIRGCSSYILIWGIKGPN